MRKRRPIDLGSFRTPLWVVIFLVASAMGMLVPPTFSEVFSRHYGSVWSTRAAIYGIDPPIHMSVIR